jgi:hypothetical protein
MTMRTNIIPLQLPIPCPVCGKEPYVEECWARGPWAVGCYGVYPTEHFCGVNDGNRLNTIRKWNAEATEEQSHG